MKIIAIIITLVCCCLMFVVRRETKAALLVLGAMTLTLVDVPGVPLHRANYLLPVAFLLSEWRNLADHLRLLTGRWWIGGLLLLAIVTALIAAFTSSYVGTIKFLQSELLFTYFALAYAFWAVRGKESLKPLLQVTFLCAIVLTVIGVMNYLTKSADMVNALTAGKTSSVMEDASLGDVYLESNRFRVQSLFKLPFDYGYTCTLILLLHLWAWHRRMESWQILAVVVVCCLFGIITCECRIVWLCCFVSVSVFYLWSFPLSRNILTGIFAIYLFLFAYAAVPSVQKKVNKVTDVFKESSQTGGSSLDMRMTQMAMTLQYIDGYELLGRGQGYYAYSRTTETGQIEGLQGLESVIFHRLLERGIVGFVLWAAFYTWIGILFWRNKRQQKLLSGLGMSILAAYLTFAIGTGELGSVYPTMLLLGIVLKVIEQRKETRKLAMRLLTLIYAKKRTADVGHSDTSL
ncbi:MAG: O-antigen ligase family protein [Bacteroidaceae bacterium]|nr:O-antigen ligase family protein [Bacteroidaceae bacterium]